MGNVNWNFEISISESKIIPAIGLFIISLQFVLRKDVQYVLELHWNLICDRDNTKAIFFSIEIILNMFDIPKLNYHSVSLAINSQVFIKYLYKHQN